MNWEVVNSHRCTLGESPVWDAKAQRLLWVDIPEGEVHSYFPDTGQHSIYPTGTQIGAIALRKSGGLIGAAADGFFRFDINTQTREFISDPEVHLPGNRFNDGKCDPAGRFWAGSMSMNNEPGRGKLYCLEKDLSISIKLANIGCSNGLAWSPDHRKFYYIDTLAQHVMGYDYATATGEISNPEIILNIPKATGYPDGMTIDSQGMLWIAVWGASKVIRCNPANGFILNEIHFPATQVTSCTFGGENLDELYVTSACAGLTRKQLDSQPLAGKLFVVRDIRCSGVRADRFAG
ncbi:SMP-30/gluconolactonase/LRE family protein [Dyadobacter bucti]|uniref:SMP-30/gluconolactonase/LRE family protein n=1 Tax=Dyadobacter bucti TaxID=2572203 RepID=UPI0011094C28|nr:SMP-30/gluconolactonase/LRE family protein [Dyadobacter bucti]